MGLAGPPTRIVILIKYRKLMSGRILVFSINIRTSALEDSRIEFFARIVPWLPSLGSQKWYSRVLGKKQSSDVAKSLNQLEHRLHKLCVYVFRFFFFSGCMYLSRNSHLMNQKQKQLWLILYNSKKCIMQNWLLPIQREKWE